MITTKKNVIGVYWDDIRSYDDGGIYDLTSMYTEGELALETSEFVVINNPETITTNSKIIKNHPFNKPLFYYIPKVLINKIVEYDGR